MAISKRLRFAILRRDRYTCHYCGARPPRVRLVIDHVVPRNHGGTNDQSNLVTACDACNSGKADTMPETWLVEEIRELARVHPVVPCDDDGYEPEPYELAAAEAEDRATADCWTYLTTLPGIEVLCLFAQVCALSVYRPTYNELLRAAATLSRRESARTGGAYGSG